MAYVFFRIPEDSNLWAEGPRAKALHAACCVEQAGCFPGLAGQRSRPSLQPARRVGTAQGAALMTDPSSPSCRQTPLFLWFLEPAGPRGVSSTLGRELSRSSTPGKYLFRALAPAEEEMKATLEPSGRCGHVALSASPDCLRRPGSHLLGPGPATPPCTQACFGGEPGVPAVGSFSSGTCQFSQQTFLQLTLPGTTLGPGHCP